MIDTKASRAVLDVLNQATATLRAAQIPGPELDARLLLCAATGLSSAEILTRRDLVIERSGLKRFEEFVVRRRAGEPVFRIIGRIEFYGREFEVAPNVLLPRQDTETLIDAVLEDFRDRNFPLSVLDIGTGSGILAITIAAEYPNADVMASDVSRDALELAKRNAELGHIGGRLAFLESDLFEMITGKFDIIVSNPPYIASTEIPELAVDVRNFDPGLALDGGVDGLEFYVKICSQAAKFLRPNGHVYLEIGHDQADSVSSIAEAHGLFVNGIVNDLSGHQRIIALNTVN